MEQEEFFRLLRKYRTGNASEKEKRIVEAWYEALGQKPFPENSSDEELEKRYWRRIASHIKTSGIEQRTPSKRSNIRLYPLIGIAASLIIAILWFFYLAPDPRIIQERTPVAARSKEKDSWKLVANTTAKAMRVVLPDSSHVTLKPQSSVKLPSKFSKEQRVVHLEGEAFFEVVHRKEQPFLVYANGLVTKVLGTSFTIKAFGNDKDIVVSVSTGRVSVTGPPRKTSKKASEIILTPNQKVVYDKSREILQRSIVEAPQPILKEEEITKMRFEGAAVSEIFLAIEKLYGVDLVFDEERYGACTLTTSVSDGGLYNRLDIITSAIGASYRLQENTIIISGTGCE